MKYHFALTFLVLVLEACNGSTSHVPAGSGEKHVKNADSVAGVKNADTISSTDKEDKYFSNFDPIKLLPGAVSKFIPEGYLPLDTAVGDLNLDGTNDLLLVYKSKYEDTLTYPNDSPQFARPLLILIGKPDGTYILSERNDSVIMPINSSGIARSDPFTGLKIKNGFFSIEHGVSEGPQHWETVATFKYDKEQKEWYLFKDGVVNYQLNDDPDTNADAMKKVYEKIKTKKDFGIIPFGKYDIDKR